MGDHDGEIHIRDESSDFLECTGGGLPCCLTLCGVETISYEVINPRVGGRMSQHPTEPTCMGCIMVRLQNQAEAQALGRRKAQELWDVVQAFYPPDE